MTYEDLDFGILTTVLNRASKNPNDVAVPVQELNEVFDHVASEYDLVLTEEQKSELIEKYSITH